MKILIIGGTVFLGRHLVEAAIDAGHEVTVFNRGMHNADLFPQVEKLRGNRVSDLSALKGKAWDAAIDTCGYVPSVVRKSTEYLRDAVEHYTFISSCSVYGEFDPDGSDENSPIAKITAEQVAQAESLDSGERPTAIAYGEAYGGLKYLCERAAEAEMPDRVLNVRAGLIVGRYDSLERFTYWVRRTAQGGRVLAPGNPQRRVRIIDADDLSGWIIQMAERRTAGTYNVTGAEDGLTFGTMLDEIRRVSGSDAEFVWASEQFLEENGVAPWSDMPLWVPDEFNGVFEVKNDKAIALGLKFRRLADTITHVLNDLRTHPPDKKLAAGIDAEREKELLRMLSSET